LLLYSLHLPLGVPNWPVIYSASSIFSGAVAGEEEDFCKGSFRTHILYFVLSFALLYFYLHCFIKNPKKLESLVVVISLLLVIMLFPKYVLEDLSVGSGTIIGKSNIEEFFNHISM
jgi:cell division protein FtsW (lipid II flippase)